MGRRIVCLLISLFSYFTYFQQVHGLCRMIQTEREGPRPVEKGEEIPKKLSETEGTACPEYIGKDTCCRKQALMALDTNFSALDKIFGWGAGGCDICSINLKRFWCYFTCDSNQDKWSN
jgi:hypothetical protein